MTDHDRPLVESDVADDPVTQFSRWFAEAAERVRLPEAVAVATADLQAIPSVRMVLLKHWDDEGFVFYTNHRSQKGRELDANPNAALLAHWDVLGRQVRVDGPVARVPAEEADAYFDSRPRGHQISAHASHQSEVISSRRALEDRVAVLQAEFEGRPVPRPQWWGGYRIRPLQVEFWQHRDDRLHDRLRYVADGDGWRRERLQP